ncbi:hypothetical protein Tco_0981393 [Tanacetum coccineum]
MTSQNAEDGVEIPYEQDSIARTSSSSGVKHLIPSRLTRYLNLSSDKALVNKSANWYENAGTKIARDGLWLPFESQYIASAMNNRINLHQALVQMTLRKSNYFLLSISLSHKTNLCSGQWYMSWSFDVSNECSMGWDLQHRVVVEVRLSTRIGPHKSMCRSYNRLLELGVVLVEKETFFFAFPAPKKNTDESLTILSFGSQFTMLSLNQLMVSQYGVFQFMDTAYWSPVQFI